MEELSTALEKHAAAGIHKMNYALRVAHVVAQMRKLVPENHDFRGLMELALALLDYKQDEVLATVLFSAIIENEGLAKALAERLEGSFT